MTNSKCDSEVALEPCPFCGSPTPQLRNQPDGIYIDCYRKGCSVEVLTDCETVEEAIERWNTRLRADSAAPVVGEELEQDFTKHLMQRHEELALYMKQECGKAIDLIEQYTRPDFYAWLLMDHTGQKSDPYKRATEAKAILQKLIDSKPGERTAAASPAAPQVESGWLLEKTHNGQVWYITVDQMITWTTDPLKALRFARREDAERLTEIVEDCERIVAVDGTPMVSAAPPACGMCDTGLVFTEEELEALTVLYESTGLRTAQIIRQALRVYQIHILGEPHLGQPSAPLAAPQEETRAREIFDAGFAAKPSGEAAQSAAREISEYLAVGISREPRIAEILTRHFASAPVGESDGVERWKGDLIAAGWIAESATAWRAPDGSLWRGPYGAWKELQRRNAKPSQSKGEGEG